MEKSVLEQGKSKLIVLIVTEARSVQYHAQMLVNSRRVV